MKIETKKINVNVSEVYNVSSYPSPGFYEVNGKELFVIDESGLVWGLGSINNYSFLTKETETPPLISESIPSIPESFALKMLAVAMNNHMALDKL